jgi:N-acetyl-alpha-D-glucosaminyl L-malate synthase BshA
VSFSIGIVCFPSLGGSGVIASELAVGLADRGHDVHLVATALPGRAARHANITFHEVAVPDYPIFEHAPYSLALASKIVEVVRQQRIDLLQVHYAVPHAASAYLARQILGPAAPRLVTSLHGTDVTWVGSDPAYRAVTCFTVAASDGVTAPSASLRDQARARLGLPERVPIEVIPNFVDTERFTPAARRERGRLAHLFPHDRDEGPVLFHVSTFRPVKRIGDLLEVLARVRRELPARLIAIGDGPERGEAERRARELGLERHVAFPGKRAAFVEELRHADAFLLPSQMESFGVAALEALSAGVPVFGYRVGGLPEVVDDGVGRLVAPFDVDALARAIVEVVGSPAARDSMAAAARRHVLARFRREPALDRYQAYFRHILESP